MFSWILFFSIETQPFVTEFFALIGFAVCARSKPVKMAARAVWSKFRASSNPVIPDFQAAQKVIKFDQGSSMGLVACAMRARGLVNQNSANLRAISANLKNRIKIPISCSIESAQTVIKSATFGSWRSYGPTRARSSASARASTASSASIYNQQNNLQQNNYGLFHWYGNNSQCSEKWVKEFGKKRFWQGAFAGSVLTAWLLKPSERSKDKKD